MSVDPSAIAMTESASIPPPIDISARSIPTETLAQEIPNIAQPSTEFLKAGVMTAESFQQNPGGVMNDPKMMIIISAAALVATIVLGFVLFLKSPKNKRGRVSNKSSSVNFPSVDDYSSSSDFDDDESDYLSTVKVASSRKGEKKDNTALTRIQFDRQDSYMLDNENMAVQAGEGVVTSPNHRAFKRGSSYRFLSSIRLSRIMMTGADEISMSSDVSGAEKGDDKSAGSASLDSKEKNSYNNDKSGTDGISTMLGLRRREPSETCSNISLSNSHHTCRSQNKSNLSLNLENSSVPVPNKSLDIVASTEKPLSRTSENVDSSNDNSVVHDDEGSHSLPVTGRSKTNQEDNVTLDSSLLDIPFAEQTMNKEHQKGMDQSNQVKDDDDMLDVCNM